MGCEGTSSQQKLEIESAISEKKYCSIDSGKSYLSRLEYYFQDAEDDNTVIYYAVAILMKRNKNYMNMYYPVVPMDWGNIDQTNSYNLRPYQIAFHCLEQNNGKTVYDLTYKFAFSQKQLFENDEDIHKYDKELKELSDNQIDENAFTQQKKVLLRDLQPQLLHQEFGVFTKKIHIEIRKDSIISSDISEPLSEQLASQKQYLPNIDYIRVVESGNALHDIIINIE